MTDPNDKLSALSSVAAYFANKLKDDYFAGVWRSSLPHQLFWEVNISGKNVPTPRGATHARPTIRRPTFRRPRDWCAPSWSFMFVDGPNLFGKKTYPNMSFSYGSQSEDYFHVLGASMTLVSERAAFGSVTSGLLHMRCRLDHVMRTRRIRTTAGYPFFHEG